MSEKQRAACVLGTYAATFFALFAQFPLRRALPGNTDTVLAIALSNTYLSKAAAWLQSLPAGDAMFPAGQVFAYGEAAPGAALFFIFFRLLGLSDVNAYYGFISLLFTLTAFGAYIFAGIFIERSLPRWFVGLAFACSNMMFAHIDDSIVVFYFLPLVSITLLYRSLTEQRPKRLFAAAILAGLQVYFSVYVYVYLTLLLLFFGAVHLWRGGSVEWRAIVKSAFVFALISFPLLFAYRLSLAKLDITIPYAPDFVLRTMSWRFPDALLALPNNLIYGQPLREAWGVVRHLNFIGLLIVVAGVAALFKPGKHRLLLGGIAAIGFVLSWGPVLKLPVTLPGGIQEIPSLLYPFYEMFPIFKFHRVPVRAYFLVLLALTVLAGMTVEFGFTRIRSLRLQYLAFAILVCVHLVENVPVPFTAYYRLGALMPIPPEYERFASKVSPDAVFLDLPSNFGFAYTGWNPRAFADPAAFIERNASNPTLHAKWIDVPFEDQNLTPYIREAVYMNWQTVHRRNIAGGCNGYFPTPRLIFDRWLYDLPSERVLRWLRENGVDYLAFHKQMVMPGEEGLLQDLIRSPYLQTVFTSDQTVVFQLKPGNASYD